MSRLLVRAAQAWLRANEPDLDAPYATTENGFLIAAEEAYFLAINELRRARAREQEKSVRRRAIWLPEQGWVVYQLIDAMNRVMYVGVSGRPRSRIRQHLREFGDRIERVDYQAFGSRVEAFDAETALIRHLKPPLNIVGIS